jgi:polysaccharide export outer membrane protein
MACARRGPKPAALGAVVPAEVAALAAAEQRHEYRIQAGDELHVRFLYHPDMSEQLPVRPDGRISLLSTGEVLAVGLTPTELERLIAERSSSRLREPEVTVVVTRLAEQRVYVGGEVGKPGYVTLQPEMTPLQAILHSGGFRRTAKLDSVLLLTPQPGGQFSAARVDIAQVVNDGVPERVRVHPGSVVYVPANWIGDMNAVVDLYVRGLIPVLPRVGAGYSINQSN